MNRWSIAYAINAVIVYLVVAYLMVHENERRYRRTTQYSDWHIGFFPFIAAGLAPLVTFGVICNLMFIAAGKGMSKLYDPLLGIFARLGKGMTHLYAKVKK